MTFRAPVRDLALSLKIAGHPALVSSAFSELDEDTVGAVLEAAGAFTEEQLAPLNRKGDQVGAKFENGQVIAAPGFAQAYMQAVWEHEWMQEWIHAAEEEQWVIEQFEVA